MFLVVRSINTSSCRLCLVTTYFLSGDDIVTIFLHHQETNKADRLTNEAWCKVRLYTHLRCISVSETVKAQENGSHLTHSCRPAMAENAWKHRNYTELSVRTISMCVVSDWSSDFLIHLVGYCYCWITEECGRRAQAISGGSRSNSSRGRGNA